MKTKFKYCGLAMIFLIRAANGGEIINAIEYGVSNHLVPRIVAKEVCSCLYNSRVPFETCKKKIGLPRIFSRLPVIYFTEEGDLVHVHAQSLIPSPSVSVFYRATATFDRTKPEEGCFLSL